MIVKMIILRLLGSSDDKEREDRRGKARRAAPTGVPLRCLVQEEIEAKSA